MKVERTNSLIQFRTVVEQILSDGCSSQQTRDQRTSMCGRLQKRPRGHSQKQKQTKKRERGYETKGKELLQREERVYEERAYPRGAT